MMLELGKVPNGSFLPIADLAKRAGIQKPYLAKLAKQFVKKGLLEGRKGPGGGVQLSKLGREANFYDVCVAVNEPITRERCFLSKTACNRSSPCPFHARWGQICGDAMKFLKSSNVCRK